MTSLSVEGSIAVDDTIAPVTPARAHHLHQLIELADPRLGEVGPLGLVQRADHPDGFEPELWMIGDDRADLRGLIVDAHDQRRAG